MQNLFDTKVFVERSQRKNTHLTILAFELKNNGCKTLSAPFYGSTHKQAREQGGGEKAEAAREQRVRSEGVKGSMREILPFAFCLLPSAFCLLPFTFCLYSPPADRNLMGRNPHLRQTKMWATPEVDSFTRVAAYSSVRASLTKATITITRGKKT
jgi:hypothetical protein